MGDNLKNNVFWIASYPKSGNTWLKNILKTAGANYGFPTKNINIHNLEKSYDAFPVNYSLNPAIYSEPCPVLKTHRIWPRNKQPHQLLELNTVGFIHIYRNPLDVLLSYINFTRIMYKQNVNNEQFRNSLFNILLGMEPVGYDKWKKMKLDDIPRKNLDNALEYFTKNNMEIAAFRAISKNWIRHTRTWKEHVKDGFGVSIRYEDCLNDKNTFKKILPFFKFSEQELMHAIDYVDTISQDKSKNYVKGENPFFNKMQSYYYKEYFSENMLDKFLCRYEAVLMKHGYSELFNN